MNMIDWDAAAADLDLYGCAVLPGAARIAARAPRFAPAGTSASASEARW